MPILMTIMIVIIIIIIVVNKVRVYSLADATSP